MWREDTEIFPTSGLWALLVEDPGLPFNNVLHKKQKIIQTSFSSTAPWSTVAPQPQEIISPLAADCLHSSHQSGKSSENN